MKKYITIAALLAAGTTFANADAVELALPNNTNLTQTSTMGTTWEAILDKVSKSNYGAYAGGQNGWITNWPQNGEGTWDAATGTITLCGRSGVAGDAFALVLGSEIEAGTKISSFTFDALGVSTNTLNGTITMGFAVADTNGNYVKSEGGVTFNSKNGSGKITLDLTESLTWADGYKVLAVLDGLSGSATTAYNITGISVSYEIAPQVPEPSAFGLLAGLGALALVASRRRRK